jgi:O-acetyl-ADP-ribose deacetylase (regulator of RNase III)
MQFTVVQGDIAAQEADALVNAANTGLRMGAGVAGALRETAGEELNEEAVSRGPIDLGGAVETDAYDLDAEYVVHAAAMPPGGRATEESIRDATRNALALADDLGCESLVLPAIGTGVAGFSLEEGARIVCEVLDAFEPVNLGDVRFIAYSDGDFETVSRVASESRG